MKPTYLALNFAPSVELLRPIRLFVTQFFQHLLGEGPDCERLELATQELLENAMKYCHDGETRLRVAVSPLTRGAMVSVHTRNAAAPANIARLERTVNALMDGDPQDVYLRILGAADEGGGLGLARICAEADLELIVEVVDGDVDIRAQGRVEHLIEPAERAAPAAAPEAEPASASGSFTATITPSSRASDSGTYNLH